MTPEPSSSPATTATTFGLSDRTTDTLLNVMRLFAIAVLGAIALIAFVVLLASVTAQQIVSHSTALLIALALPLVFAGMRSLIKAGEERSARLREEKRRRHAEHVRALEASGAIVSHTFYARRAFEVAEYEDEGLHYFIELQDGSVLVLSGQYLYDYKDFPCTEFTIKRHRHEGTVAEMACTGYTIKLDVTVAPFNVEDFADDEALLATLPRDGQVFRGRSYDDVKSDHLLRGTAPGRD